jgi:hypothetical protein
MGEMSRMTAQAAVFTTSTLRQCLAQKPTDAP